jgi:predicted DNA-binding transcriptional regulator AlpA
VHNRNQEIPSVRRRFGGEIEVEALTGISRRTLQKDRLLNRRRFPWYKVGRKVLYDLDEVEAIIRRTAKGGAFVPPDPAEATHETD